jgi:hypothetical protein
VPSIDIFIADDLQIHAHHRRKGPHERTVGIVWLPIAVDVERKRCGLLSTARIKQLVNDISESCSVAGRLRKVRVGPRRCVDRVRIGDGSVYGPNSRVENAGGTLSPRTSGARYQENGRNNGLVVAHEREPSTYS